MRLWHRLHRLRCAGTCAVSTTDATEFLPSRPTTVHRLLPGADSKFAMSFKCQPAALLRRPTPWVRTNTDVLRGRRRVWYEPALEQL